MNSLLNPEVLIAFIGGQIEIQNEGEGYILRGQIKAAEVTSRNDFRVTLDWMAEGKGFPPQGWNTIKMRRYEASLEIYSVSNIGPSPQGGDDRLCLNSSVTGELVVLFPANGSKLDTSKVEGFVLPKTKEEVEAILEKGIDGKKITIYGENPGGCDSVRYYFKLSDSSERLPDEVFSKLAVDNGFSEGWELINLAEGYQLVRGAYSND